MSDKNEVDTLFSSGKTPVAIVYVPGRLFKAAKYKDKKGKESGEPKHGASFLLPKDGEDAKILRSKTLALIKAKWPGKDPASFARPYKDGDKFADTKDGKAEWARGHIILAASTGEKYPPQITDARKGFAAVLDASTFYNGALVAFEVRLKTHEVGTNQPGVNAYLQAVCFIKDGDRLPIGGKPAAERFAHVVGSMSQEDPTEETGGEEW